MRARTAAAWAAGRGAGHARPAPHPLARPPLPRWSATFLLATLVGQVLSQLLQTWIHGDHFRPTDLPVARPWSRVLARRDSVELVAHEVTWGGGGGAGCTGW